MNAGKFRYFVILGAMRTGSNLLERSLDQFPDIAPFGELFNPGFIGGPNRSDFPDWTPAQRDENPLDLLKAMMTTTEADALPGFRLFQDHDPRVLNHVLDDETCAKIVLHRNTLDSYVSLKIAKETGQWMLGGIAHRKSAKVQFSAPEYARFQEDREDFYLRIQQALQKGGQTAFSLEYTDLKALDTLNGLARFLGIDDRLEKLDEPHKRQNPEPLSEKVTNFDEMRRALTQDLAMSLETDRSPATEPQPENIPFIASEALNLVYLPIPGVPDQMLLKSLRAAGGVDRSSGAAQLEKWLAAHPGATTLTLAAHPLDRAHAVFCDHILPGDNVFKNIRRRLIANFNLPEAASADDPNAHRIGFEVFLKFLQANLAGQTAIRVAREWDAQSAYIAKVSQFIPISQILRSSNLPQDFARIASIDHAEISQPKTNAPLAAIYDADLESLCRSVYGKDYLKLGFCDWQGG